ncbi:MAG: hypothetical protein KBA75_04960 [Alphaproteobacteria bacterium]|nr:hypothetical protein [Alphaproteobacteria bacterium]
MFLCSAVPSPALALSPVACTEMGCVDGLMLSVAPDYRWHSGAYVFRLKLDGRAVICQGSLPLKACDMPSLTCDGVGVMITESGCALQPEAHGFGDIQISSGPQQVAVSITRDGQTMVDKTVTPTYRTARPNGPQCEPECRQASLPLFEQ